MKKTLTILIISAISTGLLFSGCKQSKNEKQPVNAGISVNETGEMNHNMKHVPDDRISLNLPPKKAQHQLMNMRSHLKAVQSIIKLMSADRFDSASSVASEKLGLTEEMKMMCSSFGNERFEKMGMNFHKSADRMSEILKTGDKDKSLEALSVTLSYCINCHSTFKQ